jgi:hypothetical protein
MLFAIRQARTGTTGCQRDALITDEFYGERHFADGGGQASKF